MTQHMSLIEWRRLKSESGVKIVRVFIKSYN